MTTRKKEQCPFASREVEKTVVEFFSLFQRRNLAAFSEVVLYLRRGGPAGVGVVLEALEPGLLVAQGDDELDEMFLPHAVAADWIFYAVLAGTEGFGVGGDDGVPDGQVDHVDVVCFLCCVVCGLGTEEMPVSVYGGVGGREVV